MIEQLRICDDVFGPKVPHYPPHILGVEVGYAVGRQVTQTLSSRTRIFGVRYEHRIGRLMNDAMRRDLKLTTQDEIAFVALHILPAAKNALWNSSCFHSAGRSKRFNVSGM